MEQNSRWRTERFLCFHWGKERQIMGRIGVDDGEY